ncbi:AraC-like ligand binding domain-containing protein [Paenibacillus catalpae]|uniref:AraC-like ligand binding domain-containing protein n=1 Tax=Paenibacillus catalpae TaxID=1045775 RepID=A0A1I2D1Q9_9BACL|nr:AraC family transcriptional regulator [Paenibacillus catalpae]SFE74439.1 AraC-like ligand binding domain-containing protein [Paenibacillus catalpae]
MKPVPDISRDLIELPSSFPIVISQTEGVSPLFQRLHWHAALEINYISRGSGYYLINGTRYEFREGDIILINSNDLHRAFENEELMMTVIMFDPAYFALEQRYDPELLIPFREIGMRFDNLLDRGHPMLARLGGAIEEMRDEFTRREPHFEAVVRSQLVQFMAFVNRYFAKEQERGASHTRGMETVRQVLNAMEADIVRPWTLKELAASAHLSPSRFSALFVQTVGTSPMDYLIQLRLSAAVSLLEASDKKIIEIADICGFRNLSNFNRLFKQHIGKQPSDLRSHTLIEKQ